MNDLIKVNTETMTVSARDLHEALEIRTAFKDWFPRMLEYGFEEGKDFSSFLSESTGGRPSKEYNISIDMAKQICMIQRSSIGKTIRQYFIDLEKAWNTPEQVMARALKLADETINNLKLQLEEQKPLVEFAEHVTMSSDTVDIGELAKIIKNENIPNMGRNRLFEFLRDRKILMSNNLPYQKYIEQNWFEVIETVKNTAYGSKVFPKTLVTGKGQVEIVEMLRDEIK